MDPDAKEFNDLIAYGTYEQLLKLYHYYKGLCNTKTANFMQNVVVQFIETYCIEINRNTKTLHPYNSAFIRPTIQPSYIESQRPITTQYDRNESDYDLYNFFPLPTTVTRNLPAYDAMFDLKSNKDLFEYFGDEWDTGFDDCNRDLNCLTLNSLYMCNIGTTRIPTVLETSLYFKSKQYYLNLYTDPYIHSKHVQCMLSLYLYILHKRTIEIVFNNEKNPWNFTLHDLELETLNLLNLKFMYDRQTETHKIIDTKIATKLLNKILDDMHRHDKYMTLFVCTYSFIGGIVDVTDATIAAHAVVCGIIKDNNRIVLFILDPNGVQVPLWYKKYMKAFNYWNTAHVSHSQIIFNSFNEKILQVLNVYITKRYPNTYSISTEIETNINEFKLNFTGNNEYQVGGYCALFCVLLIHIIYNNINIHNRDVFRDVKDLYRITEYIKDLLIFLRGVMTSPPFSINQFIHNYSINIFRFFLSSKSVQKYYQVFNIRDTVKRVNDKIMKNPKLRNTFREITMGNVMPIYMNVIFEGLQYLPSMIGVPKENISSTNYLNMLNMNDYSSVEFYTPFRNVEKLKHQPLVSWFNEERKVYFTENGLQIPSGNDDEYLEITDPFVVLLNLDDILDAWADDAYDNELVSDFDTFSPSVINDFTATYGKCKKQDYP